MKRRFVLLCVSALLCVLLSPLEVGAVSGWLDFNREFNNPEKPFLQNRDFNDGSDYYIAFWNAEPSSTTWVYRPASGIGSTGCAYGNSGGQIVLYQIVTDQGNLDRVEGYYVEFAFYFKSTTNDDVAQASIMYQTASGGPWTPITGQWFGYSSDISNPWSQAYVRTNSALPSSLYSLKVQIAAKDGSGGDTSTATLVDEARLRIIHDKISDLTRCSISLAIDVDYVDNSNGYNAFDMSIGVVADGKTYSSRQYFICGVTITATLEPHQAYFFPWGYTDLSDQYVGFYLWPSARAILRVYDDDGNERICQGNNAKPEIQGNSVTTAATITGLLAIGTLAASFMAAYISPPSAFAGVAGITGLWALTKGGTQSWIFSALKQYGTLDDYGSGCSADYRTQITFNYGLGLILSSPERFATQVTCTHGLTWKYPYPQVSHGTGEWYLRIQTAVDIGYLIYITEPMTGYLMNYYTTYTLEDRVYAW